MVRLTRNKPYTLHARSLDRITGTPSDYKLNLRDPITCADDHHIKATFVSCTMPSTFYQIDAKNNQFTVRFNQNVQSLIYTTGLPCKITLVTWTITASRW